MGQRLGKFMVCALLAPALIGTAAAEGVIDRIRQGGKVVIGHRESSVPFSYFDADRKPVGYAIDLCMKIVEAAGKKAGVKNVPVEFVMVTAANRITAVQKGQVDMECGSTTNNAERRQVVAFTIPHFIVGARLLVKADSPVDRLEDLMGKRMVSTKGSTPLAMAQQANKERLMGIKILEAPDHARGVEMVEKGEAEAFLMDDVLLAGLIAGKPNPGAFKIVGKFVTTEALAIALPKGDAEFKKVADDEMRSLIQSQDIYPIYDKWFMKPIPPKNAVLNLRVSYLLHDFWKYPSDWVPF